jgi:drug/metabolite transporter (DMT)-like permease
MFAFALTSPLSYGVVLCYGIGSVFYLILLRNYPLAEVTLTILACMMCMVAISTLALGQTMTATQWLGAALTGAGVILLQVR